MTQAKILVFAKAPIPGLVKTRLIPALGEAGATSLYQAMVLHTLEQASMCPDVSIELWCALDIHHPFISACAQKFPLTLREQKGDGLGERMHHAFQEVLCDSQYALLIGTDCPSLTNKDFSAALSVLQQKRDAVFVPAEDGGYTLIGLRKADMRLFKNVSWGSDQVMAETRARMQQLGLQWCELPEKCDVDRPEDLAFLSDNLMQVIS